MGDGSAARVSSMSAARLLCASSHFRVALVQMLNNHNSFVRVSLSVIFANVN